jgi:ABC-type dipeptide/oligopeptide/nickel transport system permease component
MSLGIYVVRRLGLAVITLFGVVLAVFLLTRVLPGNPAYIKAGPYAKPEQIARITAEMGLDKPVPVQFWNYFTDLLHGDMGLSWSTSHPVREDLMQRLPATLELALAAFAVASIVGLVLGILAAVKQGSAVDQVVHILSVIGASVALFWLGLMLIYVFYYKLRWVPDPMGRLDALMVAPPGPTGLLLIDTVVHRDWAAFKSAVGHLVLPTVSLAIVLTPTIAKMARAAMLEVLQSDYVQTARAIGLSTPRLVWRDALPNAMIPILTTMGIVLAYLLAGNVLIESLFAWPGIGFYAWGALMSNDFDAIQGFVLLIGILYVFINLGIDLLYSVIDPRIRLG